MRLAPLLFLVAMFACGSPAQAPDRAPVARHVGAADVEEISFEISALM